MTLLLSSRKQLKNRKVREYENGNQIDMRHVGEYGFKYLHFAFEVTTDTRKGTTTTRSLKERGREIETETETGSVIETETETTDGTEIETGTETGIETEIAATDAQGEKTLPRTVNQKEVIYAETG